MQKLLDTPLKEKNFSSAGALKEERSDLRKLKERYLAWMIASRYADTTVKGAHADLEAFLRFLEFKEIAKISDVTTQVLNDYSLWLRERKEDGKSSSVLHIKHRLIGVRQFFSWLTKEMEILYNPAEDLELPKTPQNLPKTIITQAEAQRLLDAPDLTSPVGYRDKALLELVYATGIRTMELFNLKVEHVDLKVRTLFVKQGKGNKDRIIPLPVTTVSYLKEYMEKIRPRFAQGMRNGDDGTLFINYTGGKLDMSRVSEIFHRNEKLANLDKHITPMTLRHSIASHLLENGMDIRYIQEFLGHEKLSTTQGYAKVTLSGLRKMYNKHHPKEKRQQHPFGCSCTSSPRRGNGIKND